MDKKKIIVFWDNDGFDEELSKNDSFIVYNSHSEFNSIDEKTLREAGGFLVLCELPWDHESAKIPRREYGGIRLVQRFIRNKMSLKAPVVFASAADVKTICDKHKIYRIIKTPALKHKFVKLPASRKELVRAFLDMDAMTDTELAYTKLIYCDIKGLLVQINHILEGRSNKEQEEYRKDIEYVLKEQFNNDTKLLEAYHNAKDLSDLCKTLLARIDGTDNNQVNDGFLDEPYHDTIRILLLEDEPEKDDVKHFVEYIQEIEKKAQKQKAIEIKAFEKDAKALRVKVDALALNKKNEAINYANKVEKIAKKTFKKKLEKKAKALKDKANALEEIPKEMENKKEIWKRKFGEEKIAFEEKALAIVEEAKVLRKTANALEKIAEATEDLANTFGGNEIKEEARAFKEDAKALKEDAKALETRPFTKPLFTITIEKNADNIEYDSNRNQLVATSDYSLLDFDVVICDIEIWNDKDELVTLGFNVIESMAKEYSRPLYYIVTNVSRSFYDQIKIPYIRRIRLKKEVFGTKASIKTFLYGIKEVYDNRKTESKEQDYKIEAFLNKMYDYIHGSECYPKQFGKPFAKDDSSMIKVNSFDDIENKIIKVKSMELIKHFLILFNKNPMGESNSFDVFNHNCEEMRTFIEKNIGYGNEKLHKIIAEREKNKQSLTTKDIDNFIIKLILRRFFLYVMGFISNYALTKSFEVYKKNKKLNDKSRGITEKDLACRAISKQFMSIKGEKNRENNLIKTYPLSQCLNNILLFAKERESLRLKKEEQDFVDALGALGKEGYPESESCIKKLKIDY